LQDGVHALGIFIVRSDYLEEARTMAQDDSSLVLLIGDQLVRYYAFLAWSRMEGHSFLVIAPDLMTIVDSARNVYAQLPKVLIVANNRGGIGKSTTALNVANGLAEAGKSVLAVDMDPQANFTEMLGGHIQQLSRAHLGHYFAGNVDLGYLLQNPPFENMGLLAAHPDMSKAVIDPGRWPRRQIEFAKMLRHPTVVRRPSPG
jgi:Mrp family chromosome partitioning ATPase